MSKIDSTEAVSRFCTAIGNIGDELVNADVDPAALAAALRMEASRFEAASRQVIAEPALRELLDLTSRAHEFVNTLQIAGIPEQVAVTCLVNACVERMVRLHGVSQAATWMAGLVHLIEQNRESFEELARGH